jgi:predicted acyl esterase
VLNLFGNGLIYHSEPFEEPLEMTGWMKLALWIELDVPDTDFHVVVYELFLDGSQIQLSDDFMRAHYRDSIDEEKLVVPGEINCYEFTRFTFFCRQIARGSRLRLMIQCPNSIYLQKNYNSGSVTELESGKDARTAHIRLYHDANHPSYLELPVVKHK